MSKRQTAVCKRVIVGHCDIRSPFICFVVKTVPISFHSKSSGFGKKTALPRNTFIFYTSTLAFKNKTDLHSGSLMGIRNVFSVRVLSTFRSKSEAVHASCDIVGKFCCDKCSFKNPCIHGFLDRSLLFYHYRSSWVSISWLEGTSSAIMKNVFFYITVVYLYVLAFLCLKIGVFPELEHLYLRKRVFRWKEICGVRWDIS